jgi:hydroxymethylpyrimidine pyrophosphatase-like HAD family hydrolase
VTSLIATDLDRTLIYSRRFFTNALPEGQCVEIYNGEGISFITREAALALRCLAAGHLVVPTTTRTIAQYERIRLPGGPYRYAITSNGGNILVDGTPDQTWTAAVANRIQTSGASLDTIATALTRRLDTSWALTFRVADDLFCYLVVDETTMPASFVTHWRHWCQLRGWDVSQQGRKVYTMPQTLCKSYAVEELYTRLLDIGELPPYAPVLAAGDGVLDARMLENAAAAIRPAHGELHSLGWRCENTTVTTNSGAHAADEILSWLRVKADSKLIRPTRGGQ